MTGAQDQAGAVENDAQPQTRDGIPVSTRPRWMTIRDLLPLMWLKGRWDLRTRVVAAFLTMLVGRALALTTPFIYKWVIDSLSAEQGQTTALLFTPPVLIVAYGTFRVLNFATSSIRRWLMFRVNEGIWRALSTRAFDHVSNLPMRFHLQLGAVILARAVERGASSAHVLLNIVVFDLAPTLVEFVIVTILIVRNFGWVYAGVMALSAVFYFLFTTWSTEQRKRYHRTYIDAAQETGRKFYDAMTNMESVKNFTNEQHEYRRYDHALSREEAASVELDTVSVKVSVGHSILFRVSMTVLMVMTAFDIMGGRLGVGSIVLISSLMSQFYNPIETISGVYARLREALIDSEQLLSLLALKPDVVDRENAPDLRVHGAEIRFENVNFGYHDKRPILNDISFTVPSGHTVALVGSTGAGKSTVAKLLFRYFDVSSGRILIDVQDIRDITQLSLRRAIGIVPQDTVLFNETIAYNIEYGWPGTDKDTIMHAAKLAQLHEAIMEMPDGYDSMVGERGLQLSGGEKQRVAIARALLRDPKILILDEATASLDTRTEQEIQAALDKFSANRTTMVIAHRLSTIVNADQILVLDHGRIVERGHHDELIARGGLYADMWARQVAAVHRKTDGFPQRARCGQAA